MRYINLRYLLTYLLTSKPASHRTLVRAIKEYIGICKWLCYGRARSNIARASYHYILRLFIFFSATLSQKTDIPETFPQDVA